MKTLFIGTTVALALATSASAADMPPYKASPPPPVSVYDWGGFYVGADVRYDWEDHQITSIHTDTGMVAQSVSGNFQSSSVGLQAGYNFMLTPSFLLGIEADINRDNAGTWVLGDGAYGQAVLGWSGSARGRIGYAVNNLLFYGTGGLAWSEWGLTRVQIMPFNPTAPPATVETANVTPMGWTGGGGVEVGLWPRFSVKVEYRHTDYGSFSALFPISQRQANISSASDAVLVGANYRFGQ
jgi:opacity protein-like surface antigen